MSSPHPEPPSSPSGSGGVPAAELEVIYADLRRYGQNLLAAERPEHTLQATALVHEAMVKLLAEFGERAIPLPPPDQLSERRRMLFAMLSMRMRQALVEHARHRDALKGPGRWSRSALHEAMASIDRQGIDVVALDRALTALQRVDADAADVFEHRWFGGMAMKDIANAMGISPIEAQRRWTRARKALRGLMRGDEG